MPTNESVKATGKLLGCFASFVLVYLLVAFAIWHRWGLVPAGAAIVLAPISGYATLRLVERVIRIGGLLEGYHAFKQHRTAMQSVLATRAHISELTQMLLLDVEPPH